MSCAAWLHSSQVLHSHAMSELSTEIRVPQRVSISVPSENPPRGRGVSVACRLPSPGCQRNGWGMIESPPVRVGMRCGTNPAVGTAPREVCRGGSAFR